MYIALTDEKDINTCSVFGHSDANLTDKEKKDLRDLFIDLIENKNVRIFYFGRFGNFDELCWEIISELKRTQYPDIKRIYCLEDQRYERANKRPKYLKNEDYEEFVYFVPDNSYWMYRILFRNKEIIKHSDYAIFYIRETKNSGAYKALKFAQQFNVKYFLI